MNSTNKNVNILEKILKNFDDEIVVNRLIYKIPMKYLNYLKNNNLKFSKFVNEAIAEKIEKIKLQGDYNGKK